MIPTLLSVRGFFCCITAAVSMAMAASPVHSQSVSVPRRPAAPAYSTQGSPAEVTQARLLGYLVYRQVNVKFDNTPVKEAIAEIARQAGVSIVGRYSDDRTGQGIDPETTITAALDDVTALDALEQVLDQCSDFEQCTWQLRKGGYVEVGTKARLAAPAARELRIYHVRDLMIEAPYFASDGPSKRKEPEQLVEELFGAIVDSVEPEAWDPVEQPIDPASGRNELRPEGTPLPGQTSAPLPAPQVTTTDQDREWGGKASEGKLGIKGKWGSMRVFHDQLLVTAPDFVHRQLNGYPKAIIPPPMPACPPAEGARKSATPSPTTQPDRATVPAKSSPAPVGKTPSK